MAPSEHSELGRDGLTALSATRGQDAAAGTGAHTRAEAVLLGTTAVVWLEGALRHVKISGSWPMIGRRLNNPLRAQLHQNTPGDNDSQAILEPCLSRQKAGSCDDPPKFSGNKFASNYDPAYSACLVCLVTHRTVTYPQGM